MTSKPQRIERLQVAIPLDELKAIEDFRLIRRGLATSEKQTSASKKNRKTRYLKIFYRIRFAPLEKNWPFPKSLAAGRPMDPVRASADVRRAAHFHVAQRRMWL